MKKGIRQILIIEDNERIAEDIRRTLSGLSSQCQLKFVASINDAISSIYKDSPSLVLCEYRLPDGTFHDLLKLSCYDKPVLVMIADDESMCHEGGKVPVDFIVKSVGFCQKLPASIDIMLSEWDFMNQRSKLLSLLKRNCRSYLDYFHKCTSGIIHVSLNGEVMNINSSFARSHGYDLETMKNATLKQFSPEISVRSLVARLTELPDGDELNFELENRRIDGHKIPLQCVATLVANEVGRFMVIFCNSLSAQPPATKVEVRSSQWDKVFNNVSDLIFIVDDCFKITHVNQSLLRHLGLTRNKLSGRKWYDVFQGLNSPALPSRNNFDQEKLNTSQEYDNKWEGYRLDVMPLKQVDGSRNTLVHLVYAE
ncbi:MAG: PAS domain S-box protein [Geobacteraceae bacterium]|nr:PAS domain S-box protein [Geobacteraceae bacterium]